MPSIYNVPLYIIVIYYTYILFIYIYTYHIIMIYHTISPYCFIIVVERKA